MGGLVRKSLKYGLVIFSGFVFFSGEALAGYKSLAEVPEERKPYIQAYISTLESQGVKTGVAAAITARGGSESEFHPWTSEGIYSNHAWSNNTRSPSYDSPPAFGFLQMQDRSPGGRLGKMIAKVESYKDGKGTTDPVISSEAQALFALEEFKDGMDHFATFTAHPSGAGFSIPATGVSYEGVLQSEVGWDGKVIDSMEKFLSMDNERLATVLWTMSAVRPAGWALASTYKSDMQLATEIRKEFGGNPSSGSEGGSSSEGGATNSSEGGSDILGRLALEEELKGMVALSNLSDKQGTIEVGDFNKLTTSEKNNVTDIKRGVVSQSEVDTYRGIRVGIASFAIAGLIYSLLIIVAYFIDVNNYIFEFGLTSLITFGGIRFTPVTDSHEQRQMTKQVVSRVAFVMLVSSVVLSGSIYVNLYMILDFFSKLGK